MIRNVRWNWLGLMLLIACGGFAHAGQGSLKGTLRDQSGGVLQGVTVTATNVNTKEAKVTATDSRGLFEFPELEAGDYLIESEAPGFGSKTVQARIPEQGPLDITLAVAPLAETVTVTRTGQELSAVPNAISLVTGNEIQFAQRRASPDEALRGIPGLFAANRHNRSASGGVRLSIRAPMSASGMRGLQILQDGIPLTSADGTTQPTNMDLGSAGRIEVIRGPSSVLYGNSAGGVISVRTEAPPGERFSLQPEVQFGSYGYQRQEMKTGGTAGRLGYLLNLSRIETDGFRTHSHSEVRQANLAVTGKLSPATEIRGIFNFFDMPFGESASSLTLFDALNNPRSVRPQAIDQGWGESSTQGQGGLTLEHRFGGGQLFRATGWAMWRDVFNPIPSRVINLDRTGAGFRSEYVGQYRLGSLPVEWTAGFDVSYQRDDRAEFVNAGVPPGGGLTTQGAQLLGELEDVLSVAPFVQLTVALRPRWLLTAGARYDYYDFNAADKFLSDGDQSGGRKMSAASPKVGLTYLATDWLDVYANFSTAYQTPTTVELSNRPTGEGGFNQDLEPANLRSFELGARGTVRPWRLHYELSAYRSNLDNAFVSFQRPDEQVFFRNAGESTRNGTELLLEWTPVSRVTTRLAYTYQDFEFERFTTARADFSGNEEPGAPPHQLFLGGSYATSFGLHSTAQLRWVDAFAVNNENTAFNWAYRVVDLRFGLDRHWKGLKFRPFLGIDNLFNVRYNASTTLNAAAARYYEPAPGREFYVGLRVSASR